MGSQNKIEKKVNTDSVKEFYRATNIKFARKFDSIVLKNIKVEQKNVQTVPQSLEPISSLGGEMAGSSIAHIRDEFNA